MSIVRKKAALVELERYLKGKSCPSTCFYVLYGLCEPFQPTQESVFAHRHSSEVTRERMSDPFSLMFWSIGYEWLTQPRSLAELETLTAYLTHCVCTPLQKASPGHTKGHSISSYVPEWKREIYGEWDELMALLAAFLEPFAAFAYMEHHTSNTTHHERRLRRLRRPHPKWPQSLAKLLPHGPEGTTKGLLAWLQLSLHPAVSKILLDTLFTLLCHAHPLMLATVLESDLFVRHGIVSFASRQKEKLKSQDLRQKQLSLPEISFALTSLGHLIHRFIVNHTTLAQTRVFHSHCPRKLLDAYAQMLEIVDICESFKHALNGSSAASLVKDDAIGTMRVAYICAGSKVMITHPDVDKVESAESPISLMVRTRMVWETQPFVIFTRLIERLQYLEIAQRCMAPGCRCTALDTPLWRCGSCLRVQYCSRRCQKRAWTSQVSHKDVCSVIKALCESLNFPLREVSVMLPTAPEAPISKCADAERILKHFDEWSDLDASLAMRRGN